MFENELQTRCAICGTGILLGLIFVLAHLPLILLIVPIAVLFLGIVADPEETHAVWYGMLNTLGIFDLSVLTDTEQMNNNQKKHYFWFGEVGMAWYSGREHCGPCRDLVCRTDRDLPGIHRCCGSVPAALCVHAEADPAGYEGRCGCSHRCVREE